MSSRRIISRAFRAPNPRTDKETLRLIETDDPTGRGGGYYSGNVKQSQSDMTIARIRWDGNGKWSEYWSAWQARFREEHAKSVLWERAFKMRVHGFIPEDTP